MNLINFIDKFNKSSKGKILTSIFAFLISAVMLTSVLTAYSWFVKNTDTDASNLAITSTYEAINATYSSFYINDIDTKEVVKDDQYVNAQGVSVLDIKMLPFDMTFKSINQYAPVVLRILIYDIPSNFIPEANQTQYVSLVISRDTSLSSASSATLDSYFSSIGQIGCYSDTSLTLDDSNSDIYNAIIEKYKVDANVMSFTTYNNSTYTKTSFLDKSIAYSSNNFLVDSNGKSCLVLYMCFDYNDPLASAYAEQERDDLSNVNSLEQSFEISNDISTINVDFN